MTSGDLEVDVSRGGPRGDAEGGEQHGSRPEVHPLDAHVPQRGAEREQHREEEEAFGKEGEDRAHPMIVPPLQSAVGTRRCGPAPPPAQDGAGPCFILPW